MPKGGKHRDPCTDADTFVLGNPIPVLHAHWLGCSYVTTAVSQSRAADTNAFLLQGTTEDDKQFVHEPNEIEPIEVELLEE